MIKKLLIIPMMLTLVLSSCIEEKNVNTSTLLDNLEVETQFDSNELPEINIDKLISSNGTKRFTLNNTIEEIESKSGIHLDLRQSTDECYTGGSSSDLQLLFLRDTLISVDFFDSSYQTSKGFKVDDEISKLLSIHPEVEYHESISNMGDESYYVTTKSYTTQPDKQGNAFTFHVSDSDPNTIRIITVTNYTDDHSPCNAY